jgi:hypothetical protein
MIALALLGAALLVALAWALVVLVQRRRKPPELRGDWWGRFEREFRAYCERVADSRGEAKRQRQRRQLPPL